MSRFRAPVLSLTMSADRSDIRSSHLLMKRYLISGISATERLPVKIYLCREKKQWMNKFELRQRNASGGKWLQNLLCLRMLTFDHL